MQIKHSLKHLSGKYVRSDFGSPEFKKLVGGANLIPEMLRRESETGRAPWTGTLLSS